MSQTLVPLQVLFVQHGWPEPPQGMQLTEPLAAAMQIVVVRSLQVCPCPPAAGQQGCPAAPQSHAPCMQVPKVAVEVATLHVCPSARHCPAKQQPPPLQVVPSQHGSP
jgi:hypothetical protein